jgi:tRNA threonylcarbamoyladenosine biosynthesis protein TsaB
MLVLGIETSTQHTSVALGTESGTVAALELGGERISHELVVPAIERLLDWAGLTLRHVGGVAVGIGPGLFTGMRVGIATARSLAQAGVVPIVGVASLDVLAFMHKDSCRVICPVVDAKRGEVFYAFYRPVPGGVARQDGFQVGRAERLAADIGARGEDILVVGGGGLVYRRTLEDAGSVEFGPAERAFPSAAAMVDLTIPRFLREDFDRVFDVEPIYLRRSDAEIAWDRRTGAR